MKLLIVRKRKIFKKKAKRQFHKEVAKRALLKRKVPARTSKLLKKSNLGKDIEEFVKENRIGADAWHPTGVAIFDGNLKTGPRVTYQRIKENLDKKYGRSFSYGTVVQFSVVKSKRQKSAKRYWGAANIKIKGLEKVLTYG